MEEGRNLSSKNKSSILQKDKCTLSDIHTLDQATLVKAQDSYIKVTMQKIPTDKLHHKQCLSDSFSP